MKPAIISALCVFSWISASVSLFHIVEVQPGEDVTLSCFNFTNSSTEKFWFKLDSKPNTSRISSMRSFDEQATFYNGFVRAKFTMTSNTTTLFLSIKQVNVSDSGLYFCGFYSASGDPVIISATYLKVEEGLYVKYWLMTAILAAMTFFMLLVIIFLIIKIKKHPKAHEEVQSQQQHEDLDYVSLNYASVKFRRPAPENQPALNVIYASTR